jgi:hypothetical protein
MLPLSKQQDFALVSIAHRSIRVCAIPLAASDCHRFRHS